MVAELADLAKEYNPVLSINARNEFFNKNLMNVLEEYSLAIVDSLRQKSCYY
jgi:hypothetical protein